MMISICKKNVGFFCLHENMSALYGLKVASFQGGESGLAVDNATSILYIPL